MSRSAVALLAAIAANILLLMLMQQLVRHDWALPQAETSDYGHIRWLELPPALPTTPPPAPETAVTPPPPEPTTTPPPTPQPPVPAPQQPPPRAGQPQPAPTTISPTLPALDSLLAQLPNALPLGGPAPADPPPPPALLDNPVPRLRVPPEYPPMARRLGVEGEVIVEFLIDRQGRVQTPQIVESRPARIFDAAALRAIAGWQFEPPSWQGQPVEQRARQRFQFRLRE